MKTLGWILLTPFILMIIILIIAIIIAIIESVGWLFMSFIFVTILGLCIVIG